MVEAIIVLLVLGVVGFFIIKNYNPAVILIGGGILLLIAAAALGHPLYPKEEGTGFIVFDIFMKLKDTLISNMTGSGLILMILFGYSGYMNKIGANQVAVDILVAPMKKIKSQTLFIPIVFLLGNLMSLVVPSASSLAIILMAILYPMLQGMGISSLTAAGIIAMTATIMPTPLGADNVIAAETLEMNLMQYVMYNAQISIPVLLVLAIVHCLWQKHCDKVEGERAFVKIDESKLKKQENVNLPKIYALLPVLPLLLILAVGITAMVVPSITMDVFILTFILSICFSTVSNIMAASFNDIVLFIIMVAVISIGILFDAIGTAGITAKEATFHSMSSAKVKGAKEALTLIKSGSKISSICNDVIGDVCGIVSGGLGAVLAMSLSTNFGINNTIISVVLSAFISSFTVGGKAIMKNVAMRKADQIIHTVGKVKHFLRIK